MASHHHMRELATYTVSRSTDSDSDGDGDGDGNSAATFRDVDMSRGQTLPSPSPSSPPPLIVRADRLNGGGSGGGSDSVLVDDNDEIIDLLNYQRQQRSRHRRKIIVTAVLVASACIVTGLLAFLGYTIAKIELSLASASAAGRLINEQWLTLAQAYRNASNSSADPCDDFYEYVCGGMLAHTELAPDEASRGMFHELRAKVEERLLAVAEAGWPIVSTWFDTCEDMHARDALSDYYLDQFARALTPANNNNDDDGNSTMTAEELLRSLAIMHSLGGRACAL